MYFGVKCVSGAGLITVGDSFTVGMGASDTAHAYVSRLGAYLNSTVTNLAISGTGTDESARALLGHTPIINRASNLSILSGYNDVGSYGAVAFNKMACNTRAMLAAAFLRECQPASLAPRYAGNWTLLGPSVGGAAWAAGGAGMYTDDGPTSYLEFNVFGETVVVGGYTQIADGHYKDFNVSIDGCPPVVFHGLGQNIIPYPAVGYNALVLQNLGFGRHTVRVSPISAGPHTVIDYVGSLIDPRAAVGCLIGTIPTRTNWTEHGCTTDQTTTDAASAVIAGVVNEFCNWPVGLVPINDFYPVSGVDVGTDGYHPTDHGHLDIYNAFKSRASLWHA